MAMIARHSDEASTPALLCSRRNKNTSVSTQATSSSENNPRAHRERNVLHPECHPLPNAFFNLPLTIAGKNSADVVAIKINKRLGQNNIYCTGIHSVPCLSLDGTNEATCKYSFKAASLPEPIHHRQSQSYASDMRLRCIYNHTCRRNTNIDICISTIPNGNHKKMDRPLTGVCENSNQCLTSHRTKSRTTSLCDQSSNVYKLTNTLQSFLNCPRVSTLRVGDSGTARSRRTSKPPSMSIVFTCVILLLSTMNTNLVAGRRQNHRRGGPRYTRESGFSRGMARSMSSSQKCEAITVPLCRDIGYNKTRMSLSIMNKFTQAEAKAELDLFNPLLKVNCSAETKLFLCSIYTPICMEGYRQFLPPCRFICERTKRGCLPFLQNYNYAWPEKFRCEQFPVYTTGRSMCMHFNLTKTPDEIKRTNREKRPSTTKKSRRPKYHTMLSTTTTTTTTTTKSATRSTKPSPVTVADNSTCTPECRDPMVKIDSIHDPLYSKVSTGNVRNCALPCKSPYFTDSEISTAESMMKWLSVVCFIVTLLTVSTYLIDMDRFEYPQRPIIFMSVCYLFVSVGFLIRIVAGHEAVVCGYSSRHILYHSSGPPMCVTVFLLTYFFSMASAIWWVILSMTWFLAAALKWGNESIAKYFQVYHIVAWIFPSILTILALVLSSIDGDALSGICYVGNQDLQNLRGFVLFPLIICFAAGGLFLLVGFVSLIRIRTRVRKDGKKTQKFERLIVRIGIFNVLYMISAAILVGCYFYEQVNRTAWEININCGSVVTANSNKPFLFVLMARYLMTLVIGITNGVWICSSKTLDSWKGFYRRCMCCLSNAPCSPPCGQIFKKASRQIDQNANIGNSSQKNSRSTLPTAPNESIEDSRDDAVDSQQYRSIYQEGNDHQTERSRASRHSSGSRKPSSAASKPESCVYCSQSACNSSNSLSGQSQRRKVKRSKRKRDSESYSQGSAKKRNPTAKGDEASEILCSSNTTSTVGSDRPAVKDENVPIPDHAGSLLIEQDRAPFLKPDTAESNCANSGTIFPVGRESTLSPENGDCCIDISEKYVINCDNLPPPVPHQYSAANSCVSSSQCWDYDNSVDSVGKSERSSDVGASLVSRNSEIARQCNNDMQPYFYHHYHHYNGKILS